MAHIEYPQKTSEWGKVLIDGLNKILEKMESQMTSINDNTNTQVSALRDEMLLKVNEVQNTASRALATADENAEFNKNIRNEMDELKRDCEKNNKDIRDEMILIKEENKKISKENDSLRYQNEHMNNKCIELNHQTNSIENYSRRKNLVIRGISETEQESDDLCESATKTFMKTQLKLSDAAVNEMQFVKCHRTGPKFKQNHHGRQPVLKRPIIVRFCNFRDKSVVWQAKSKLLDKNYSISENFSRGTEFNRRKLYAVYKKAKSMEKYQKKISLNSDVLVIDSIRYTAESLHMLPKDLDPRQFGERTDGNYLIVGGIYSTYHPLSNWYKCDVTYKGNAFSSVEQGYQWAKATFANDDTAARKLLYTTDPREAKELGMKVQDLKRDDWNAEKDSVMGELVKIKFTDNPELKQELLSTQDLKLAEAGVDNHYAIGLSLQNGDIFDCAKWKGQNCLGKILCEVRSGLKEANI